MSLAVPQPIAGRRPSLIFIAVTVCLDVVAQSITFPVLPRLAEHLLGGDRAAAARWVGVLEVAWVIPQFFAAPVLGMLSDHFGRRPVILISVFGVGAELIMGAWAPTIGWLLLARILCGLTCGAQAAAMAYVADVTPPETRMGSYGWLSAAAWSGIILGPALGGLLAVADIRAPFLAAAAFALAGGAYGVFGLPESLPAAERAPLRWSTAHPWGALRLLLGREGLPALALVFALLGFAQYANQSVMVLYTAYRYGWTPLAFGLFCSAVAVTNIAVQTSLASRIVGWIGERRTLMAGLAAQAAGFVAMGCAPSGAAYCAANAPLALGNIIWPALQSLMTGRVRADEQGRLQGAVAAVFSLTGLAGPVAFTQIFAWSIAPGRSREWSGTTLLLGAGLSVAAWAMMALFVRRDTAGRGV